MAHFLNDILNKASGKTPIKCDESCKYWRFPHLDTACELSSIFSVAKQMPCYEYQPRPHNKPLAVEPKSMDD